MQGKKTGGRKAGTPNRPIVELQDILKREKCDPRVIMARIANNELTCGVCRGKKKTPYILPAVPMVECPNCKHKAKDGGHAFTMCPNCTFEREVRISMRRCMSCKGTTMDNCSPGLRFQAAAEILSYLLPKRKAIEVSGGEDEDGAKLPVTINVHFKKPDPPASDDETRT